MTYIKVKNKTGTVNLESANYTDWIDYWKANTKKKIKTCASKACKNKTDFVGAHVENVKGVKVEYITQFCRSCNGKNNDTFSVDKDVLVRTKRKDTKKVKIKKSKK